jgi:hypothetical protein
VNVKVRIIKLPNRNYIRVKISGGSTAQILGLMSAIFASNKLGKPFKVIYYPYSTGTYWPFAIGFLLSQKEIISSEKMTIGVKNSRTSEIGKIVKDHPLLVKNISYEHFLRSLRKIRLLPILLIMRRELSSTLNPKRILKLNKYFTTISGKFPMLNISFINAEMDRRFNEARIPSPFSKDTNFELQNFAVIHYRLGDKRASTLIPDDFTSDGIINPVNYKKIVEKIPNFKIMKLFVVSDEPFSAQKLLASVGINAKIYGDKGNIWDDLYLISQSNIFIGAINSQVTQLANICVESNGGQSYILVPKGYKVHTKFSNTFFSESTYLPKDDSIYKLDFFLGSNAHSAYTHE